MNIRVVVGVGISALAGGLAGSDAILYVMLAQVGMILVMMR